MEIKILDRGFIKLVDFMGGDIAVVQAARVSYGQGSKGEEKDKKLINFLLANHHETPFEHAVFKFHVNCPIFVARQWFRHRMASYNEISGRYTELTEEFYLPEKFRAQKDPNYEYVDLDDSVTDELRAKIRQSYDQAFDLYQTLLSQGVARELARIVLPLALYTQFYWSINARALMNFLSLRAEEHAQYEIRQYALAILSIFEAKMPWTCAAFKNFYLKSELDG